MKTMKEREIIKYMTSEIQAKMPNMEQVRANCLNQETNFTQKTGQSRLILRKPAVIVALIVCFTMLVSAAAAIYQMQYIPFKGFVAGGEYEVYYTPEILKFDNPVASYFRTEYSCATMPQTTP